jgi:hypothetical protein
MQKLLIILLMFCYGYSSIGATLNLHYCMNELVGVSKQHKSHERCGKCGMKAKKSKGCCKDKVTLVKASDDHKQLTKALPHYTFVDVIVPTVYNTFYYKYNAISIYKPIPNSNAPPDIYACKRYIKHCVFLI